MSVFHVVHLPTTHVVSKITNEASFDHTVTSAAGQSDSEASLSALQSWYHHAAAGNHSNNHGFIHGSKMSLIKVLFRHGSWFSAPHHCSKTRLHLRCALTLQGHMHTHTVEYGNMLKHVPSGWRGFTAVRPQYMMRATLVTACLKDAQRKWAFKIKYGESEMSMNILDCFGYKYRWVVLPWLLLATHRYP